MASFVEDIIYSLRKLPGEVHIDLNSLREYDIESNNRLTEIREMEAAVIEEIKKNIKEECYLDEDAIALRVAEISSKRESLLDFVKTKQVQRASELYARLDSAIISVDLKINSVTNPEADDTVGGTRKRRKKKDADNMLQLLDINIMTDVVEEDPNEPLYCTCRRVSSGQMIGCDGPDCPIEWFHIDCVGVTDAPEHWYCSECSAKMNG